MPPLSVWTQFESLSDPRVKRTRRDGHRGTSVTAVVCVADVVDCIPTRELRGSIPPEHEFWGDFSDGERGMGRFAFKLQNVRVLKEPFYVRGQQGLWELSVPGFEGFAAAQGNLSLFGGADG